MWTELNLPVSDFYSDSSSVSSNKIFDLIQTRSFREEKYLPLENPSYNFGFWREWSSIEFFSIQTEEKSQEKERNKISIWWLSWLKFGGKKFSDKPEVFISLLLFLISNPFIWLWFSQFQNEFLWCLLSKNLVIFKIGGLKTFKFVHWVFLFKFKTLRIFKRFNKKPVS